MPQKPRRSRTRHLQFGTPDIVDELDHFSLREAVPWRKTRLLCVKLAAEGKHSAKEIAEICQCSRASVFAHIKAYRRGGILTLLHAAKPGRKEGKLRGLNPSQSRAFRDRVQKGYWKSAAEAKEWLESEYEVRKTYKIVWQWMQRIKDKSMHKRAR